MKTLSLLAVAAVGLLLAGCANTGGWGQKQTGGTVLGAIGGGVIGSQFGGGTGRLIATGAGTLLGAWLGNEVGASLDNADRTAISRAESNAYTAPVGQQISWSNPQSGNYGTITPTREGTDTTGNYCREFQQTIVVGGQTQQGFGRACRQPDGSWQIVS